MYSTRSILLAVFGFIFLLVATPAYMHSPADSLLQGNMAIAVKGYSLMHGNRVLDSTAMFSNSPPVAVGDSYTVHGATNIGPFLANDYDPDGNSISFYEIVSAPTHGSLFGGSQPDRKCTLHSQATWDLTALLTGFVTAC